MPVNKVNAYEAEMLAQLRTAGAGILADIKAKKALNEELEAKISTFLDDFNKGYVARMAA